MTLVEFLENRIAEDERQARIAYDDFSFNGIESVEESAWVHCADPSRALKQCEAQYAILNIDWSALCDVLSCCGGYDAEESVLRAMAAVYADHPDYLPEWKL